MEIKPAKRAGEIVGLLRGKAGMTQPDVAAKAHCHPTTVSHLENGTKSVHIGTVRAVGAAIGYEDVVAKVWGFVDAPNFTDVAGILAAYEKESIRLSVWTTYFIHTLLQTESYSRALLKAGLPFSSGDEREERLRSHNERRQAIERDDPPFLWAVIDESVLYRPYGGTEVMREQLIYLEDLAQKPHVTIQVMPFGAVTHPGFEGVLGIIEFADKTPVWYTDSWAAGTFSDDPSQVTTYLKYFDVIRSSALSPAESLDFIGRTRRERYEQQ
jgi:transcriptional regulator with XRE-family HTH domain